MSQRTVGDYMTGSPHSIGKDQPLALAHALMKSHGVRHLPVLDGGALVGMVSDRDLSLVEAIADVDVHSVLVEEAMSEEVFTVAPEDRLSKVAREMSNRRIGSAVIMDHGKVVGLFTTVDALRALAEITELLAT